MPRRRPPLPPGTHFETGTKSETVTKLETQKERQIAIGSRSGSRGAGHFGRSPVSPAMYAPIASDVPRSWASAMACAISGGVSPPSRSPSRISGGVKSRLASASPESPRERPYPDAVREVRFREVRFNALPFRQ